LKLTPFTNESVGGGGVGLDALKIAIPMTCGSPVRRTRSTLNAPSPTITVYGPYFDHVAYGSQPIPAPTVVPSIFTSNDR